jgi:hypothetical protein
VRGTVKRIEVERWGGEQARRYQVGSLNPSKTSISAKELSRPAFALVFFLVPSLNKTNGGRTLWMSSSCDLRVGDRLEGFGSNQKMARSCVKPRGPSSGRSHVRQSFSRMRLIAPRLTFRSGRLGGRA